MSKGDTMAPTAQPGPKPRLNETTTAILGSLVVSVILATLLVGNPFNALRLAYLDYSHTPAGGAAKASTTQAPNTAGQK